MLNSKGFDLWADGYDKDTLQTDKSNRYPFAGYEDVLARIYARVRESGAKSVLDIGFGTGILLKRLYDDGLDAFGVDFSPRMVEIARERMPGAHLYLHDFNGGLPGELRSRAYDAIISTYALHHLRDAEKYRFVKELKSLLNPGGGIFIGDIAFASRAALNACKSDCGDEWDDEEYYIAFDELAKELESAEFHAVSFCAGIVVVRN